LYCQCGSRVFVRAFFVATSAVKGVRKQGAHAIGDSLTPAVAPGNFGVESEARAWFGTGMCKERFASTVATSPG